MGLCADETVRLFKFPQMDFEMAIWEMTSLLIAPKKVFKSMYYHVSIPSFHPELERTAADFNATET
jgi:hypothetical protein